MEEIGSGTAIAKAAATAGLGVEGADFVALVQSGHEPATSIWRRAMTAIGVGLVNMAWLVPPEVIVLGGGVGRNHDLVAPVIVEQLRRFGPEHAAAIDVRTAELGDDAALVGAVRWWEAIGR